MNSKISPIRVLITVTILTIYAGFLIGCQASLFTYRGKTAEKEIRIPVLKGGPHTGTFESDDLVVKYQYTVTPDTLAISGDVDLLLGSFKPFLLKLKLHFLDADNKILDTTRVVNGAHRIPARTYDFDKRLHAPSGTTAIAFSYKGSVYEYGGDNGWSFSTDPRRADRYGIFY